MSRRHGSLRVTTLFLDSIRINGRLDVDGLQVVWSDHISLVARGQDRLGTNDAIDLWGKLVKKIRKMFVN